jgi:DNA-binding beta-propeller fold protein YncE
MSMIGAPEMILRSALVGIALALVTSVAGAQQPLAADAGQQVRRLMYVADRSGVSVYDIDDGHKLVKKIPVPGTSDYKGICAAPASGKLYLSSRQGEQLACIDLLTDKLLWTMPIGGYPDSMAVTPDGRFIYMPRREAGDWQVIDTERRKVVATIAVEGGPHNTVCNAAGTRMYLQALGNPNVYIADTATHKIVGKVGPFSNGVRPFAVTQDERYVLANVDGLLGFEVGEVASGKVLHRLQATTPAQRIAQVVNHQAYHNTPSHGINIRPDGKEVWVSNDVYGYCHVWDMTEMPPRHMADVPQFEDPKEQPRSGWIVFSLDGRYAYPSSGVVIDAKAKRIVARIPGSEKMIEIDFVGGTPVRAGAR